MVLVAAGGVQVTTVVALSFPACANHDFERILCTGYFIASNCTTKDSHIRYRRKKGNLPNIQHGTPVKALVRVGFNIISVTMNSFSAVLKVS